MQGTETYLICLEGTMDQMPVILLDGREAVDTFISEYRPGPVDGPDRIGDGPLAAAFEATGFGPSIVFGYSVTLFVGGKPVRRWNRRWTDDQWPGLKEWIGMRADARRAFLADLTDDPWEAPSPVPHDGDHTGGGPVG
jgi:hypothetical protein